MTLHTSGDIVLRELASVNVLMTTLTSFGRRMEIRVQYFPLPVGWLVASDAGYGGMSARQRKFRGSVIKVGKLLPVGGGVAGFATLCSASRFHFHHTWRELALVRILVASGACQVREVIGDDFADTERPVTIVAGGRNMCARQREARSLMTRQPEHRRVKSFH